MSYTSYGFLAKKLIRTRTINRCTIYITRTSRRENRLTLARKSHYILLFIIVCAVKGSSQVANGLLLFPNPRSSTLCRDNNTHNSRLHSESETIHIIRNDFNRSCSSAGNYTDCDFYFQIDMYALVRPKRVRSRQ